MNKLKLILKFLFIVFIVISNHLNAHDIHTGHAEGLPKIRLNDGEEFNGGFIFEKENYWFFQIFLKFVLFIKNTIVRSFMRSF